MEAYTWYALRVIYILSHHYPSSNLALRSVHTYGPLLYSLIYPGIDYHRLQLTARTHVLPSCLFLCFLICLLGFPEFLAQEFVGLFRSLNGCCHADILVLQIPTLLFKVFGLHVMLVGSAAIHLQIVLGFLQLFLDFLLKHGETIFFRTFYKDPFSLHAILHLRRTHITLPDQFKMFIQVYPFSSASDLTKMENSTSTRRYKVVIHLSVE